MIKKVFKLLFFTFLIPIISMSQNNPQSQRALILIDIQDFYFVEGTSQLVQPEEASEKAANLLAAFRESDELIVHVRHAANSNASIHQNVIPLSDEKVITKKYVNSFRETELLNYLRENEITQVVICGMMTHMCVEAAARASADYGFDVVVIDDACATRDLTFGQNTVKAADVHTSALATIEGYYGKVSTVDEFLAD